MDRTDSAAPGTMQANAVPAHQKLIEMARGHWLSRIVHVAAKLEIADHLAAGPRSASDLAVITRTHAPSLYRLMRTLAGLGILDQKGLTFALTPIGEALKTGAPGAARATILTMASDWFMGAFQELLYSVQTGKSGFEKSLGMPVFDWLGQHPEQASLFSEAMIGVHGAEPEAVAAAYDFACFGTIIDVGGASGHLLTTILGHHSGPRGILYDLPHVVRDAPALIAARGLTERVAIAGGSFFDAVPADGDAYLLSHVIHDWSEEQCLTILGHCRRAMAAHSRLMLIEMVLPDDNSFHPGKILDMVMLVGPGGQERTAAEYRDLLGKAGFRMAGVISTASPASIVEAVPA